MGDRALMGWERERGGRQSTDGLWERERDGRQSIDGLGERAVRGWGERERETGDRALMGWGRERRETEH